jgi:ribosomal protein S27AE
MSTFKSFTCGECGHSVRLATGPGRTSEYAPGFHVSIPDDFPIPTCPNCGEVYILPDFADRLEPIFRAEFLRAQSGHYNELVRILMLRHNATKRDIVRACSITPSYLSHVLAGKRQASTTLTRLLEAFVANGAEFERHVNGRPWTCEGVFPFAIKESVTGFVTGAWSAVVGRLGMAPEVYTEPAQPPPPRG